MASLGFFQMFSFFLAASFLVSPTSAADQTHALFAFGDGLYDLGNDAFLNPDSQYNLYPYGISTDGATGRPSDGHLVVDFIADKSNLHQRVRPYLANVTAEWHNGVSFATAGARVNSDKSDYAISTQVANFHNVREYLVKTYGQAETQRLLSNSLYVITFGTSEYFELGPDVDAATLMGTIGVVIEAYKELILSIYSSGGRKFGFQNLGPLREMPHFKNLFNTTPSISCDADNKPVAQWHNIMLEERLRQLATCEQNGELWLQGFRYAYFDYYSVVTDLTNSFYNGTDACCGSGDYNGNMTCAIGVEGLDYNLCSNRSQYVWFDGVHPSQAANEIIAEQFWSGNSTVVRPYNLKQLLEGTDDGGAAKATTFSVSV